MAFSYNETTSSGLTAIVNVPFPYLAREHVHVAINGEESDPSDWEWPSGQQIELPEPPSSGDLVKVYRSTPAAELLVNFTPGGLDHRDLNNVSLQLLYIVQEAFDVANDTAEDLGRIDPAYYLNVSNPNPSYPNDNLGSFVMPYDMILPASLEGSECLVTGPAKGFPVVVQLVRFAGGVGGAESSLGTFTFGFNEQTATRPSQPPKTVSEGDLIMLRSGDIGPSAGLTVTLRLVRSYAGDA